jgi:hypothetical protein
MTRSKSHQGPAVAFRDAVKVDDGRATALDHASFEVARGEKVALPGPSCSSWPGSPSWPTGGRTSSPAARPSGCASHSPWPAAPSCFPGRADGGARRGGTAALLAVRPVRDLEVGGGGLEAALAAPTNDDQRRPRQQRELIRYGNGRLTYDPFLRSEIPRALRNVRFLVMPLAFPVLLYVIYAKQNGTSQGLTVAALLLVSMRRVPGHSSARSLSSGASCRMPCS